MLEPDGVKVACPVLRGLGAGNGLRLLDTPKSERLTDIRPKIQWKNIDWIKVIKSINRLQTRITKAVLEL